MELLLYIILFFFIYWGIRAAIKLFVIFRQIHKVKKQFDDLNKQWNGNNPFGGNAQGGFGNDTSHSGFGSNPNTGYTQTGNGQTNGNAGSSRRYTTTTGDVIEDRRTEDEINRRIFTQDEGEYVDFEEVE